MVADSLLQRLSPPPDLSVELAPHAQPRRRLIPATGTVLTSHRPGGLYHVLHLAALVLHLCCPATTPPLDNLQQSDRTRRTPDPESTDHADHPLERAENRIAKPQ